MSDNLKPQFCLDQPNSYQIMIQGSLSSEWSDWFDGLKISPVEGGNTILIGQVLDEAALHGVLKKIRDLGLPLLSVVRVEPNRTNSIWE